jgi:hypothetical protein
MLDEPRQTVLANPAYGSTLLTHSGESSKAMNTIEFHDQEAECSENCQGEQISTICEWRIADCPRGEEKTAMKSN